MQLIRFLFSLIFLSSLSVSWAEELTIERLVASPAISGPAAQGVKTLRKVQIGQGPGVIEGTRRASQKWQIMEIIEKDPFLFP